MQKNIFMTATIITSTSILLSAVRFYQFPLTFPPLAEMNLDVSTKPCFPRDSDRAVCEWPPQSRSRLDTSGRSPLAAREQHLAPPLSPWVIVPVCPGFMTLQKGSRGGQSKEQGWFSEWRIKELRLQVKKSQRRKGIFSFWQKSNKRKARKFINKSRCLCQYSDSEHAVCLVLVRS